MRSEDTFRIFSPFTDIDVISHLQGKFNQYLSSTYSGRTHLIWRHQALFATAINRGLWWATCVDGTPRFLAKTWAATQWASRDFYILFASMEPLQAYFHSRGFIWCSMLFRDLWVPQDGSACSWLSFVFLIFEPCRVVVTVIRTVVEDTSLSHIEEHRTQIY